MNVLKVTKMTEKFVSDNAPTILTGIGVIGTVATAYLTGKATVKAVKKVEEKKFIKHLHEPATTAVKKNNEELNKTDTFKLVWMCYIPPVAAGVGTIAAIVFANQINARRLAALAASYEILGGRFDEYKDKMKEKLGVKKESDARDEIAQDAVNRNPVGKNEVIVTGGGEVLCYDKYTGRYFMSSMDALKKAENEVNFYVLNNQYANLNDFYRYIGLPTIPAGEEVGWTQDLNFGIDFSTTIWENDKPCIVLDYHVVGVRRRPSSPGLKAVGLAREDGHPMN